MDGYIDGVHQAVSSVLGTLAGEFMSLTTEVRLQASRTGVTAQHYWRDSLFTQGLQMPTLLSAPAYEFPWDFVADNFQNANVKIAIHRLSIEALAGSILQFAKQGITFVYGGKGLPAECPGGTRYKKQVLKEVIWYGRNQAAHWEDGQFSPSTTACFEKLIVDYPGRFDSYLKESMAMPILQLLSWDDASDFGMSMRELRRRNA